ncbi:MAG: NAD(P)/FAD-dependent oxidoreductase [Pseudomonadales bacterium]
MYEPLVSPLSAVPELLPDTYWADSTTVPAEDDGQLDSAITVDVAVIGAGYTGLSAAAHLARECGVEVAVLEAKRPGWGCSGRSAGFAQKVLGRTPFQRVIRRFGAAAGAAMFAEIQRGVERLDDDISRLGIACERQPSGHLWVAHRKRMTKHLLGEASFLRQQFGLHTQLLSAQELREHYFEGEEAYAALRFEQGFGVNPLKLVLGYLSLARSGGAYVYSGSAVFSWRKEGEYHLLRAGRGTVRARHVICATNNPSAQALHPGLSCRSVPVLSSMMVTPVLSAAQLATIKFASSDLITDTRTLRHFVRKLPDNRLLIGGRSVSCGDHKAQLQLALMRKFPLLQGVEGAYCWQSWGSASAEDLPQIRQVKDDPSVTYAVGYSGCGVAFALLGGVRLAQHLAGIKHWPVKHSVIKQSVIKHNVAQPPLQWAQARR